MNSDIRDIISERLGHARWRIKHAVDRFDDQEVRHARHIARKSRAGNLDVLQFGESTANWISPTDVDTRPLWAMVADGLRNPSGHLAAHGGSYSTDLFDAYLSFAMRLHAPQAVVVPLWCRGRMIPWIEHPRFSKRKAVRAIAELPADVPLVRIRRSFARPTPRDWDKFHALPVKTFSDLSTIGNHVDALKDKSRWTEESDARIKLIYAYHHTQRIDPVGPELNAVVSLGRTLRDFAGPVVVYETPISVATGCRVWGERFSEVVASNFAALTTALTRGFGAPLPVLQTGMIFPENEFVDTALADEHLNERGRLRLTRLILAELKRHRDDLVA